MADNRFLYKNYLYRNGEWKPANHSLAMVKEQRRSQVPSAKQYKYRQDLYEFCMKKGLLKDGFPLARTKSGIASNIHAFMTIIRKNGLIDEFVGERKDNDEDS